MADVRDEMTEHMLDEAGIGSGMRVLDIGCGRGDVSRMIARRVGAQGRVVGVDRDGAALAAARDAAGAAGLTNVEFVEGDLSTAGADAAPYDAVAGRRVLMYQPDLPEVLRRLALLLRPGGAMVFQEHDATMTPGYVAPLPLHQKVHAWMWQTVAREGADLHVGFHLPAAVSAAGLTLVRIRAEAVVLPPGASYPFEAIIRAMRPRIVAHGVATEEELEVDGLDDRLMAERLEAQATYIGDMVFSAWARNPD